MSEIELLPSEDYVNAKNISLFVNSELSGEVNILRPDKADNVFDFRTKFDEERNLSKKFCLYGLIESKWGDCNNVRIEFRIGDSSTNTGNKITNFPFWIYDKSTNTTAYTWTFLSKSLDSRNGELSKNLYGKIKGHYFFPFEIDLNLFTNSNKSIYIRILEIETGLSLLQEIPFFFFDEDGLPLEFGSETAEILDDGSIIEIDNNYPFFYDRHWIRRELEPIGPAYVFFTEEQITAIEGGATDSVLENKTFNVQVSLSRQPVGYEKIKIDVVYGLDENGNEYTTANIPQDILAVFNNIEWNSPTDDIVQNIEVYFPDDLYVEPIKRITLQISPILGVLNDPIRSKRISLYLIDNDIPSKVSFDGSSINFVEPRDDSSPTLIPINLVLDKKLLVPNQFVELYIDKSLTDCTSEFGFQNPLSTANTLSDNIFVNFNQNDLNYTTNLNFISARVDDIPRKIVLKLRNFSSNVIPGTFNINQSVDFTIYVTKDLDKRYVELIIPYDINNGQAVMRSAMNKVYSSGGYTCASTCTVDVTGLRDNPTRLETYFESYQGNIAGNSVITGSSANSIALRSLVFEPNFKINISNEGSQFVFDNKLYKNGETLSVTVTSGYTTGVSTDQFVFDGKQFILKLPANSSFGTFSVGFLNFSIWGFLTCKYKIDIQNKTYNYIPSVNPNDPNFISTNLLTNKIYTFTLQNNGLYNFSDKFEVGAGNDNSKESYNMYTYLKYVESQIDFSTNGDVISYSGTSLKYTENILYYPGAIILPKQEIFYSIRSPKKPSDSKIVLTKNQIINNNNFLPISQKQNLLPVSNFFIPKPFTQFQKNIRFNFGQLLVQAGYVSDTLTNYALNIPYTTPINDAFVLATVPFASLYSGQKKNRFLYTWQQANINTKNQAIIEIQNNGIVSCEIFGKTINPNEKIWISETPMTINSPNTYNVVNSFLNLKLDLPTNDNFKTKIGNARVNAFTKAKYKISFLNFVLYNADGTPSNKTVNKSFFTDSGIKISLVANTATFLSTEYFLMTKLSPYVWAPAHLSGAFRCENAQITNLRTRSSAIQDNKSVIVHGFIATASSSTSIKDISFTDAVPVFGCDQYGFKWTTSNQP